jgi:O-acetyl-ADP-ribose deacetylase (regulator of RNase III)
LKETKSLHTSATTSEVGERFCLSHFKSETGKTRKNEYRKWFQDAENFNLGEIQTVQVEENIWVCNMIGQNKIKTNSKGISPIRYEAVEKCLEKLSDQAKKLNAGIHMPRIGCGLAGGKWEEIEPLLKEHC